MDFEHELRKLIERIVDERVAARLAELQPRNDAYLTTAEAAKLAGIHADTIRRWIREGRLAEHRAGRVVRVRRDELERLLSEGTRRDPRDMTPEQLAVRDFG
jgi:excisionase family DNA binding protein